MEVIGGQPDVHQRSLARFHLSHLLLGAGREQRHRALGMLEVGQSHRDSCINAAGGHTQY